MAVSTLVNKVDLAHISLLFHPVQLEFPGYLIQIIPETEPSKHVSGFIPRNIAGCNICCQS